MDEQTLNALRSRLENERQRLENEIAELRDSAVKATTYLENETDAYDDHLADDASEVFEREKDLALLHNLEHELDGVKHALERIERGTYGTCEECGRLIAEKRLLARPMATTCIECQSRLERQQQAAVEIQNEEARIPLTRTVE
jgi:RNA polymerase-binding protein DksA